LQRLLEIKTYKTIWTMGHKIRKAMADRDASYQLAGLLEMDDAFFGPSKPGKRGRELLEKRRLLWQLKLIRIDPASPRCAKYKK
jgi:hypothetical protein